jgi:hypothetical protein
MLIQDLINGSNFTVINNSLAKELGGIDYAYMFAYLVGKSNYFNKDGVDDWFYRTADDITTDTMFSRREQERIFGNLIQAGLLDIEIKGLPAKKHFRINTSGFLALLENLPKTENKFVQNVQTNKAKNAKPDSAKSINKTNQNEQTYMNIESIIIENENSNIIPPLGENLQFSEGDFSIGFSENKKQSSAARHHEKLGGNDIQILGRERAEMKKIIQSTIEQENKRYNKVWAVMYENLSKKDSENFMELQRLFIELEPDAELRLLTFQKYLEACYEKLAKEFKPKEPQVFSISWILGVYNLVAPILKRKATEQNEKAAAAAETQEKLNEFMRMYTEPEPEPQPEKPAERRKREYYQTGEDGKIRIVTEYLD